MNGGIYMNFELGQKVLEEKVAALNTEPVKQLTALFDDGCFTELDKFLKNGENGFLSSAGNEQELTKLLNKITKMPRSEWNQIGQAAIDTAVNFSEKAVAENYLKAVTQKKTDL